MTPDLKHDIEAALHGLDYPATRNKLVSLALQNGAPRAVVDHLLTLPETADFLNEQQLCETLGVAVPGEHPHGWE